MHAQSLYNIQLKLSMHAFVCKILMLNVQVQSIAIDSQVKVWSIAHNHTRAITICFTGILTLQSST